MIEISEAAARVSVRLGQLVIEREELASARVPLEDLGALILAGPRTTISQPALAMLASSGVAVVVCDPQHHPCGMMLPLAGHCLQTERIRGQIAATEPARKRIWQQIIRAKLENQGRLLKHAHGNDGGLAVLARKVGSGDPANVEAQGARRYWGVLFAPHAFSRKPEGELPNALLNYGYALMRAATARAISAAGLHPALGVHHHNRNNAYCLADDLMEPFRPLVDARVLRLTRERGMDYPLDRESKRALLELLTVQLTVLGERRALSDALGRLASSLVKGLAEVNAPLILPIWDPGEV